MLCWFNQVSLERKAGGVCWLIYAENRQFSLRPRPLPAPTRPEPIRPHRPGGSSQRAAKIEISRPSLRNLVVWFGRFARPRYIDTTYPTEGNGNPESSNSDFCLETTAVTRVESSFKTRLNYQRQVPFFVPLSLSFFFRQVCQELTLKSPKMLTKA